VSNKVFNVIAELNLVSHNSHKYLSDLSIVIPTYNRQELILKQCIYWYGSGVQLIILDGSTVPLDRKLLDSINGFENVIYKYLPISIQERMCKSIDFIKKPFAMYCSDDNFLLPFGVNAAIEKLIKDSNLVACMGQSLRLKWIKPKYFGISKIYNRFQNYNLLQDSPYERLRYLFNNYNNITSYAVMPTEVYKYSWGNLGDGYSTSNIYEFEQCFSTLILGRVATTKDFYWVQSTNTDIVDNANDNRFLLVSDWWNSNSYNLEKDYFLNKFSKIWNSLYGEDPIKIKKDLEILFTVYVQGQSKRYSLHDSYFNSRFINNIVPWYRILANRFEFLGKIRRFIINFIALRSFVALEDDWLISRRISKQKFLYEELSLITRILQEYELLLKKLQ